MERAIKLFFFFAIVTVVLHYIGPVAGFLLAETPRIFNLVSATGIMAW